MAGELREAGFAILLVLVVFEGNDDVDGRANEVLGAGVLWLADERPPCK